MASRTITISKTAKVEGTVKVPGDKSISHRALMFAAMAKGESRLRNISSGQDVQCTLRALQELGIKVSTRDGEWVIHGDGGAFSRPAIPIDCGNSGTTMRLLTGMLAGAKIRAILNGDESLSARPMDRIITPLSLMGASITGEGNPPHAPLRIHSFVEHPVNYESPVASAQVKTAMILAGMYLNGTTSITEPAKSRDHTEKILANLGVPITISGMRVSVEGPSRPAPFEAEIPGDPSSAAFFAVMAAVLPGSRVTFPNLLINPTRFALFDLISMCGAEVFCENEHAVLGEPVADVTVAYKRELRGFHVAGHMVPRLIDEIPLLAVLACFASKESSVRDAMELRVKESDRISALCTNLDGLGIHVKEFEDGFSIRPGSPSFWSVDPKGDHRIAMAMSVLGAMGKGLVCKNAQVVETSYPEFFDHLAVLCD